MNLTIGLSPPTLDCSVESGSVRLVNNTLYSYGELKLTISYEDESGSYLDFSEMECEAIDAGTAINLPLELEPPENAFAATVDVSGVEQTFLKRHWKLLSTIVAVTWGLIIVARRLAP